jgi:F0F1-type ATP synthase assembly protein I
MSIAQPQERKAMLYLAAKAAISGIIIAAASETARRSPALGALIVSLPLVSLLALIWLWHDSGDSERVAALAQSTFWYVLPTLPMFLVVPALLRHGIGFWLALAAGCALTIALYVVTVWALGKFGVAL